MNTFQRIESAFINGQWVQSDQTLSVLNPATQEKIGEIPNLNESFVVQAIDAASEAFEVWSSLPALDRANLLLKWNDRILQNKEALARLLTLENGKPLAEARGEVDYAASFVRWFAEQARRIEGEIIPPDSVSRRNLVMREPVGVVAAITPWNFPLAMITRKCAPAFAAGCTVVLKPSELTPFSALALAKLAEEVGFPKGIFNVVTGDAAPIGKALCEDARVRKFSFTGSTRVGQILMAQSAPTLKRLSMELGGNAPGIIFEDADLEKAIAGVMVSKFRNSGQTCVCLNRIFVHKNIFSRFSERLVQEVSKLKVGDALKDESINIGPLIQKSGLEKVDRLVKDALAKGAKCLVGGKPSSLGGSFYEPTILVDANTSMDICHEEIFGPVAVLYPFESDDEVIAMANETQAGLSAYFFTEDTQRIWKVSEQLQTGLVVVNTGSFSNTNVPFGGVKFSGFGREGGQEGIEEFLQVKYVCWELG